MTAMTSLRRRMILRQASGYIELGELLLVPDQPTPASAEKLLRHALRLLDELPEPTRSREDAKLLEGEALRALGRFEEAIRPFTLVAEENPRRLESWLGLGWCLKRIGRLSDRHAGKGTRRQPGRADPPLQPRLLPVARRQRAEGHRAPHPGHRDRQPIP